jgi:hypothetical protein
VKDQKQEAGDNAQQYLAGNTILVHNNYGVTEERFQELAKNLEDFALELWQKNAPRLEQEASSTYDNRAVKMTGEVITRAVAKDPELLERFRDPRAQVVLLKAQEAYGETGDDELGAILAELVVALVAEPTRTRREIILREAIECAPRLTKQHLNALIVITLLTNMAYRNDPDIQTLITSLDRDFRPYYGSIPTDGFEYSYMGATAAGVYIPSTLATTYNLLFHRHPNAMYPAVRPDEMPQDWELDEESGAKLGAMLWLQRAEPIEESSIKLTPDAADRLLSNDRDVQAKLTDLESKLRQFIKERFISEDSFVAELRTNQPELADFLDTLDQTGAMNLRPSPVGMMIAKQAVAARDSHAASEMDKLFGALRH